LAVRRRSDGWRRPHAREQRRARPWTGAVDLVHGCTMNQPKEYPLHLIKALDLQSGGHGDLQADVRRWGGGARRRLARGSPALLDLELRCTVLSEVSTYVKLRSSRTYLGQKGGGSSDLDDLHQKGAACTSPACKHRCYGSRRGIVREGVGFSPCCEAVGDKEGDRGAASREIEVRQQNPGKRRGAQLGPMGRKKLRGTGSSCWRRTR
jgi:hypothetical protein